MCISRMTPYDRMMLKVVVDDFTECWLFTGARDQNGHGNVRIRRETRWSCEKAHRVSWCHHKGEPPEKPLVIRHTCDTANCVNPEHLIPGTNKENMRDRSQRNRGCNQHGPWKSHTEIDPPF